MIYLYANGNSNNHGCEALSKTIPKVIGKGMKEFTVGASDGLKIRNDLFQYDLENKWDELTLIEKVIYKIAYKFQIHRVYNKIRYKTFINQVEENDVCISIGGDNYCYNDITWLKFLNFVLSKKNAKTVLLGCSIEPDLIKDKDVLEDLNRYSLIIARESYTYNALCENGLQKKAALYPDTAFVLSPNQCDLPDRFQEGNMVGINVSPVLVDLGKDENIIVEAYNKLIKYILENTNMGIALIPHVVWSRSDDRTVLGKIFNQFKESKRVILIENQDCQNLKYIISKCRFFIAARTHASIAAYSSCIPTLVIGYSIKSKGIAKDIFGDWGNFVIPVENLLEDDLLNSFLWLSDHEKEIQKYLQDNMNAYCKKVWSIKTEIEKLL